MLSKTFYRIILAAAFYLASLSASAEYTFTVLDGLVGNDYSTLNSINNSGQIVGVSENADGTFLGTFWNNGVATYLESIGFNNNISYASSINDSGQIVGTSSYLYLGNNFRATLWDDGVATDLNPQGELLSYTNSINNSGQIVVNTYNPTNYNSRATLWNNGVVTQLILPQGSSDSYANSINNSGQIVGASGTGGNSYLATLWNNGEAIDLNPQGSVYSSATSINDLGQIVGFSQTANGIYQPLVWNNGVATQLINPQGSTYSDARSINNLGQIVGQSYNLGELPRATIWNNGVATDLNSFLSASDVSAGWVLISATDINDNGWIIGIADNTLLGLGKGFVLAPVPEADTSAMLLTGLGLIGFMARRRNKSKAE